MLRIRGEPFKTRKSDPQLADGAINANYVASLVLRLAFIGNLLAAFMHVFLRHIHQSSKVVRGKFMVTLILWKCMSFLH